MLFIPTAIVIVVLPLTWLLSEFQDRRWLRITLGIAAVLASFAVASLVGILERLNSNAWYGYASKQLIETTIAEIKADNTERLAVELEHLNEKFKPTYENRARYDQLVEEFTGRFKNRKTTAPDMSP